MKRALSALLCAMLLLGLLPAVSAPAGMQITSGTITPDKAAAFVGDTVTWTITKEGGIGPSFYMYYNLRRNGFSYLTDATDEWEQWSYSYVMRETGTYRAESYVYDQGDNQPRFLVSSNTEVTLRPATAITSVEALSATGLKVTWSAIPGADGYEVWRSASEGGVYTQLPSTTATSLTDTGLAPMTPYYYKVRSYTAIDSNMWISSNYSPASSGVPENPAPAINSVETLSATSLKITWNAIPGADGYEVHRSESESGAFTKLPGTTTAASFTDTGLTPQTRYYYKVRTYNAIESENEPSSGFSAASSGVPGNPAPAITKIEALSATSLKVTWSKVAGAAGYEVWRGTSKTEPMEPIKTTTALSFTNTYLTPGTRYFYRIRAYNLVGADIVPSSGFSAAKSGVPLAKPTIVSATGVSSSQIKLTWTKVTGATGYQIFRSTAPAGTYKSIKLTTALTFTAGGMLHAKTYYFKVRPYKKILTAIYYGPLSGYKAGKTK